MKLLPKDFDVAHFLAEYWQKKPLLIRADRTFADPIAMNEIAGLTCEEFIESRIIMSDKERTQWSVHNGPFAEEFLRTLPTSHWSLLVQAVDQWHDDVKAMLKDFSFIPSWRIDDIMISLASDGGGVGPHFDYYDVFLVQGHGEKRWRIGGYADSTNALIPDTDLKLLQDFDVQEEWTVGPGDIIYIPPNIAHYGVAIGDSVTYSIGFRTPSAVELLDDVSNELMQGLHEEQRFVDTDPRPPLRTGEIDSRVGEQVLQLLQKQLQDKALLTRTFGKYMTLPKYPHLLEHSSPMTVKQLLTALEAGLALGRNPSARFAYAQLPNEGTNEGHYELFVDGKSFACTASMQEYLSALCDPFAQELNWPKLVEQDRRNADLLVELYNQGSLWLVDESDEDEEAL